MSEQGTALPVLAVIGAMGLGATAYYMNKNAGGNKISPVLDLSNQTLQLQDGSGSGARVTRWLENAARGELMANSVEGVTTLYENFRLGARESKTGDCLGCRKKQPDGSEPYVWVKYDEVIRRSEHLAAGFLAKGLKKGQDTFVGIYSQNRPEWIVMELACYNYSMIVVPLYDTLGPEACSYVVQKTEIELVVCDKLKKVEDLLSQKTATPTLRVIVAMEAVSEEVVRKAKELDVDVIGFEALEELGAARRSSPDHEPLMPPRPEDLATICFTSGTTGLPKGVMLTHGNVVADLTPLCLFGNIDLNSQDTMISFLPLAHMFERILEGAMFQRGCRIGYYRGDIKLLTEDIKELRPTILPVVPRLLNRIYDKVMQDVGKSSFKKFLFDWALRSKAEELKKSVVRNDGLWDKLVFKRVREGMGGRVKLMITGSAPLSETVLTFIRAAMGCVVVEGYGQTECVACATVTLEGDHVPGHVGPPAPCCTIRLADVPDMNYFSKNNQGEVCVKGHNVFKGYYKDEEKTRETLDEDGWLHTGDIGEWTPMGTLKIIDRKKHIFKLSQGEYIAPEKIENVYVRCKYVAQVFVHGESLKSCLVAVVVPDPEVVPAAVAKELHIRGKTMAELCADPAVKKFILDDMVKVGKQSGLHSFEQVKDVHLYHELFSVENNLLTPTLKSKRPELKTFFESEIKRMYSALF